MEIEIRPWARMTEFLPVLSKTEKESLRESIQKYGVKHHILILSDGRIIDGFHRWEISRELKVDCPHDSVDLNDDDAFALGIALNLARRQLSFEQIKGIRERQRTIALELRKTGKTQEEVAKIVGVTQQAVDQWENNNTSNTSTCIACNPKVTPNKNLIPCDLRISVPKSEHNKIFNRHMFGETQEQIAADYKISQQRVAQIVRLVEARENKPQKTGTSPFPDQKYRCLVIDPPWPVKKIEREERPNQGLELDYPTMSLEEIEKIPIINLANSEGCHVFLWVTHKFLPDGLKLFEKWGVKYQCVLTWVKKTGMTPFSWMYSTEHVLFGHIGSLELEKKGCRLDFTGKVREHSRKPDEFYDLVRSVSPEPRIDLFSREKREGFFQWGNEPERFNVL